MSRFATYATTVRESLERRKSVPAPALGRVVLPVVVGVLVALGIALASAPGTDLAYQFRDEDGLVTALSSIFLAMASAFAGAAFLVEGRGGNGLRMWWLLTCLGFFFFAADELLSFHERLGELLRSSVFGRPQHVFRNWNDVIVIAYGLVAAGALAYFMPRVLRLPLHPELLAIAFASYVIHTLVDSLPHSVHAISLELTGLSASIFEESAKLFASAFFAVAMLHGLLLVVAARAGAAEPLRSRVP